MFRENSSPGFLTRKRKEPITGSPMGATVDVGGSRFDKQDTHQTGMDQNKVDRKAGPEWMINIKEQVEIYQNAQKNAEKWNAINKIIKLKKEIPEEVLLKYDSVWKFVDDLEPIVSPENQAKVDEAVLKEKFEVLKEMIEKIEENKDNLDFWFQIELARRNFITWWRPFYHKEYYKDLEKNVDEEMKKFIDDQEVNKKITAGRIKYVLIKQRVSPINSFVGYLLRNAADDSVVLDDETLHVINTKYADLKIPKMYRKEVKKVA